MARGVFTHWFDGRKLYRRGVPKAVRTALELLPSLRERLAAEVAALLPRRVLEVGPGRAPIVRGDVVRSEVGWSVVVDIAPVFLSSHSGPAVQGSVLALPFGDRAFDVVVAADVFTHIAPTDRQLAVRELARVARDVVLFNPERGTPEVAGSAVATSMLEATLRGCGRSVVRRDFRTQGTDGSPYPMSIVVSTTGQPQVV